VLTVALLLLAPSVAEARLTPHRAKVAIVRDLNSQFRYGYREGSSTLFCHNRSPNRVGCDLLFADDDGDFWCGGASATRRRDGVHTTWRVSISHCGEF
jgi:hypothetical protein